MRIGAIIQNRFMSTRLPFKCMHKFPNGETLLEQVVRQTRKVKLLDKIIVAYPNEDLPSEAIDLKRYILEKYHTPSYTECQAPSDDVLTRFLHVARIHGLDYILRVTADDPFRSEHLADNAIRTALISNTEYVKIDTSCYGEGCEVISFRLLEVASKLSKEREHISNFIDAYTCSAMELNAPTEHKGYDKLSVDTGEDWDICVKRWRELNKCWH